MFYDIEQFTENTSSHPYCQPCSMIKNNSHRIQVHIHTVSHVLWYSIEHGWQYGCELVFYVNCSIEHGWQYGCELVFYVNCSIEHGWQYGCELVFYCEFHIEYKFTSILSAMFYRTIHIEYKFTSILLAMFYRTIHKNMANSMDVNLYSMWIVL
jgi:hypothetical protein